MLLRNLMSMDVEEMLNALPLDSVVLIGGWRKTIPAELMGAGLGRRAGARAAGRLDAGGRHEACGSAPARIAAACGGLSAGTLDEVELDRAHDQLMPTSAPAW